MNRMASAPTIPDSVSEGRGPVAHPGDKRAGKVRILNLEDNPDDSRLVGLLLGRHGLPCQITRVERERDFRKALRHGDFDLVIADLILPSLEGRRALQIARELHPEIPFIFFSGTPGEEAAIESLKQGARDYVLKQRPERLLQAVRTVLEESVAQRQRRDVLRQTQLELSLKNKIASIFLTVPDNSMFGEVLRTVLEVTESESGVFGYVDKDGSLVCAAILQATSEPQIIARFPCEEWTGPWAALAEKRSVCTNQAGSFLPVGQIPIHRLLIVPILFQNEVIGHIAVANKATDYNESDRNLIEHIAKYLAPVLKVRLQRDAHEKALSNALAAKEVLLREVHHRVKNNLQIISSLLNMQARLLPKPVREMLQDSQTRIRAMALVHERLHKQGDSQELDFGNYAKSLTTDLLDAYQHESRHVELRFELEPTPLDLSQAISCGLILSELVTNSLKHAFPGNRSGEIVVAIRRNKKDDVTLKIADDGIGFPRGFNWKESKSLGLQIVGVLARQLGASLDCESGCGVSFTLTFGRR